ncbi:MAG: transporter substrate-binding domain-containing protein [Candidatus Delongbacteria bacterium]|nr:transporter substrate-binding domain-containing protein [Candidatus Delongbacteria bacterium]MBN2834453.1 transporter substrate-binding domain-containing protein [Candidatus Delongbacteria bacterium]
MNFLKLWILLLSFSTLLLAGEIGNKLSEESVIEKIMKEKVIKVGMATFVPWAMNDKNGELIGFEIDVAKKLASDMGVKIEFVPTKWSGIIPSLLTGKFDIIIGGMGITPERNLKVNFSIPYDYSGMSMVASKKRSDGLTKIEDYNNENIKIAVRLGTTAEQAAKKYFPKAELKLFDDESAAVQDLILGRVNALVASAPLPAFQALKHSDKLFLPLSENFTKEPIGFAIRKGDYDALNFFNNWILKMESEGFFKEKKHLWFETNEWEDLVK